MVALVGLLAWKTVVQLDLIQGQSAMAERARGKVWTVNVVTVLVAVALAGGVGAACHFLSGGRRGSRAAGAGMAAVLLLFVGVFSVQMTRYVLHGPGPRATAAQVAGGGGGGTGTSDVNAERVESGAAMKSMMERQRAEIEKSREELRRLAERSAAAPPVPPITPTGSQPGTATPAVPEMPVRPPARDDVNPDADVALATLDAEIQAEIEEFLTEAATVFDVAAKPPRRSVPELDKQAKAADEVRTAAGALEKRLRGADEEMKARLVGAGVSESDAFGRAVRHSIEKRYGARAMSAGSIERIAEKVKDEAAYLRDNFGRWKYDAKGVLTSQDPQVAHTLRSNRMFTESALGGRDRAMDDLRGE